MSLCHLCLAAPATKQANGYNIQVCGRCWEAAEPGWETQFEPALMQALARNGLLIPDRTAQGRLPRDYTPPANFDL
ncbi:MAG: hypothetical protein AAF529_20245 [Pseudomonadota bacterium]